MSTLKEAVDAKLKEIEALVASEDEKKIEQAEDQVVELLTLCATITRSLAAFDAFGSDLTEDLGDMTAALDEYIDEFKDEDDGEEEGEAG